MKRLWPLLVAPLLMAAAPTPPFDAIVWGECEQGVTTRFARRMKLVDWDRESRWPLFRARFAGVDGCEVRPAFGDATQLEHVDIAFWPATPADVPITWLWMCRALVARHGEGIQYTEGRRGKDGKLVYRRYAHLQVPVPKALAPALARAVGEGSLTLSARWRTAGGGTIDLATTDMQPNGRQGPVHLAARIAPASVPAGAVHPRGERDHDSWAASPPPGWKRGR